MLNLNRILFLVLMFSSFLHSKAIDPIVNCLLNAPRVESKRIGYGGELSETYKMFENLKLLTTNEQLLKLVRHENNVVSCYAGWALIDKKYPNLYPLLEFYASQLRTVEIMDGCVLNNDNLLHLFYYRYRNSLDNYSVDPLLQKFDTFVLRMNDPDQTLLSDVLNHRVYTNKRDKKRIAYFAFEKNETAAIFYLLKWNKAEYVSALKDKLIQLLNDDSIRNFDSSLYYQVVLELLDYEGHDTNTKSIIIKSLRESSGWKKELRSFMFLLDQHDITVYSILPYNEIRQLLE